MQFSILPQPTRICVMKAIYLLLLMVATLTLKVDGQLPPALWTHDFAGATLLADVTETADGNLLVVGSNRNQNLWLLCLNSKGDTLWSRTFIQSGPNTPMRILQPAGNRIVMLSVAGNPTVGYMPWLLCTDATGNELWRITGTPQGSNPATDVGADKEGNLWWLTLRQGIPITTRLAEINPEGAEVAQFIFSDAADFEGRTLRVLADGSVALSGTRKKGELSEIWTLRVDRQGKELWRLIQPQAAAINFPECICCMPDNTLLVAGTTGVAMNPDAAPEDQVVDRNVMVSKIDPSGKLIWSKQHDREGCETASALVVTDSGDILVAGSCETSYTGTIGPWLLLLNRQGERVDDRVDRFRFMGDQASRIVQTSDGGFIMVGAGRMAADSRRQLGWIKKVGPLP